MSPSIYTGTLNGRSVTICEMDNEKYYLHFGPVSLKTGEDTDIYIFLYKDEFSDWKWRNLKPVTMPSGKEVTFRKNDPRPVSIK